MRLDYVQQMCDSVIICDEIHNTYAKEDNSFGEAIQIINLYHGNNVVMIFMSATPILYSDNTAELSNYLTVANLQS